MTFSTFRLVLLALFLPVLAHAQFIFSGKITDADNGKPLIGANVKLENSLRGTASSRQGEFRFQSLKSGQYQITVSYVGYQSITQTIDLQKNTTISIVLPKSSFMADEVIVSATRASDRSGMAFQNISNQELQKRNLGQDIPQLLNFTPSMVTTSDAGAGIGYTGMRIRGSDATSINVTINGIPYNDAESAGTFFVDMPDIASSMSNVQIQRGVGASTNGAGAFGATVNLQTNQFRKEAYAETNHTAGTFKTFKNNILLGSGLINDHFTVDARLSKITSDGYIDRAESALKSFYISGGYFGKKSFARLNVFSGVERTYQAWEGASREQINTRRTFNIYTYANQVDDYQQDHYQLLSSHNLSDNWTFNLNLHYTKGKGFYEQFKENDKLSNYGLANVIIATETIKKTNLVRRRWLDNDFYGTTFSLDYDAHKALKLNFGGAINQYDGRHFGEIIWAKFASNGTLGQRYYDNLGVKKDLNLYAKAFYQLKEGLDVFADVQLRKVSHSIRGKNSDLSTLNAGGNYTFLNPKVGITYQISEYARAYSSFSVGNKEPNRGDFVNSLTAIVPQAETLHDLELGYKHQQGNIAFGLNYYLMNYKNQLIVTGQLNDVGNPVRTNVPHSFRSGIELELAAKLAKKLKINANVSFSKNKVKDFTEVIPDYDGNPDQRNLINQADIAYSPNVVLGSQLSYTLGQNFEVSLLSKYVGSQFLDNTSSQDRMLSAYLIHDIQLSYRIKPLFVKEINFSLLTNNLFNTLYESNGYTYSYIADKQKVTEVYYYAQATRNALFSINLKL